MIENLEYSTHLEHHGIKGQKWGIRRYQNPDGTLTSAGKKRYGDDKKLYNKAVSVTQKHEQAIADREKRKNETREQSKQLRLDAKELNSRRSKAARIGTFILAGPFANTTYTDFLRTTDSKALALGKTYLSSFANGVLPFGLGMYTVQKLRQNSSASANVSNSSKNLNPRDISERLRETEKEFKKIKK